MALNGARLALLCMFERITLNHSPPLLAIVALAVGLLLWRVWTFTLLPLLRPDDPKEVPYWIPVLGHAVSFFRNPHRALTAGLTHFHPDRRPFALTLANETLYIVTSPADAAAVYANPTALSFAGFAEDMLIAFGASPAAVDSMHAGPVPDTNPLLKTLGALVRDFHKQGAQLDGIMRAVQAEAEALMVWERAPPAGGAVADAGTGVKAVSLLEWSRDVSLRITTEAFFGPRLLRLAPGLLADAVAFDASSWMLIYGYPRVLARAMTEPKARMADAFEAYFRTAMAGRAGMSGFVAAFEAEQRALGIGERDIAVAMLMLYWALNLNTSKLSFWILAYILHSPSLTALIRAEVAPALSRTGAPTDTTYLLTSCPHLEAVYHESLRLSMGSASIRRVVTPTAVGGTVLRPGRNVLVPARQLHGDAAVYGADVLRFDPDRFLRDKALAKSRSFRPFGGGSTLCPGRFLAKQQIFLWVALFLGRFDVDVVPGQPFPRYEEKKPSPGVMEPVEGDDVVFMLGRVN